MKFRSLLDWRLPTVAFVAWTAPLLLGVLGRLEAGVPVWAWSGLSDGQRFPYGRPMLLSARAYDDEDGRLEDERQTWRLSGVESREGTVDSVDLDGLRPGFYRLDLEATDGSGNRSPLSFSFEVAPLEVNDGTRFQLGGSEPFYLGATFVPWQVAGADQVAEIVHAEGRFWVRFRDLPLGEIPVGPATVTLVVDVTGDGGEAPGLDDRRFSVDADGVAAQWRGTGGGWNSMPVGFEASAVLGEGSWSAEFGIPDAVLGGVAHRLRIGFAAGTGVGEGASPAALGFWPSPGDAGKPGLWAGVDYVKPKTGGNLPPVPVLVVPPELVPLPVALPLATGLSFDPDGDPITTEVRQVEGPGMSLRREQGGSYSVQVPTVWRPERVEFRVRVSDAKQAAVEVPASAWILPGEGFEDQDGNGLPDRWERTFFGRVGVLLDEDFDHDGFRNIDELRAGTNPADASDRPGRGLRLSRWTGNETARDAVGGNHGEWTGVAQYAQGQVGGAFRFSPGHHVTVPDAASLRPAGGWTVAAWIRPLALGDRMPIVARDSGEPGAPAWALLADSAGPVFEVRRSGGVQTMRALSALALNTWFHVAVTGDAGGVVTYVNGVEVGRSTIGGDGSVGFEPGRVTWIGFDGRATFRGLVDEVILATEGLDAGQIRLMASERLGSEVEEGGALVPCPEPALLAWWKAEGSAAEVLGLHAGVAGAGVGYGDGVVGRAFLFDGGSGSEVSVADSAGLRPAHLSVEAWVRAAVAGPQPAFRHLLAKSHRPGETGASYGLTTASTGGLGFYVTIGEHRVLSPLAPPSVWEDRFRHVVGAYDGVAVRLFVDGIEVGEGTPARGPVRYSQEHDGGRFHLGSFGSGGPGGFQGRMDEVRVYGRGLALAEVRGLFDAGGVGLECARPPSIVESPTNRFVALGSTTTLSVVASGTGPLRYLWLRNGAVVPGRSGSDLTLAGFRPQESGRYVAVVANDHGMAMSEPAVVLPAVPVLPVADVFGQAGTEVGAARVGWGTTRGASTEVGEPVHGTFATGPSVWLNWTAPANGIVALDTLGSGFDTVLAVYTGSGVDRLSVEARNDDAPGEVGSRVEFRAVAGTTYRIAVAGAGRASGDFVLGWLLTPGSERLPRFLQEPESQTVVPGGTAQFVAVAEDQAGQTFQWFFGETPVNGATTATLRMVNAGLGQVGTYRLRATIGARSVWTRPVELQLNTVEAGGGGAPPPRAFGKFAEVLAYVRDRIRGGRGGGARRAVLSGLATGTSGTQIFSTDGGASEPGEPVHCGVRGGHSQWFGYSPPTSGTLTIDTDGSAFDTILAVYVSSADSEEGLTSVACDNDGGGDGRDSRVSFEVVANEVYYVVVDGVDGASGVARLNYNLERRVRFENTRRSDPSIFRSEVVAPSGQRVVVERSADLRVWEPFASGSAAGGVVPLRDEQAAGIFLYRARLE